MSKRLCVCVCVQLSLARSYVHALARHGPPSDSRGASRANHVSINRHVKSAPLSGYLYPEFWGALDRPAN